MKKIIMTGGGTAGHVTPNIALMPGLKDRGYEITYIGSIGGIEKGLIEKEGIPYHGISSGKLRRYFDLKNFSDPFRIIKGYFQAKKILKKTRPNIVFSKGGFVAVPVVFAAWRLDIPAIIHESDMTPGLANKLCVKKASVFACNFAETVKYLPANGVHTGLPIREELKTGSREAGLAFTGLSGLKPVIMIVGGSTGSVKVNNSIRAILPELLENFDVVHLCGKGNLDESLVGTEGYLQYEYIREEMKDLLAMADLVVSRAGANAICELLAIAKPNVLIPLSAAASRGDQILNANSFKKQGFSEVIEEEDITNESLKDIIVHTYEHRADYESAMKNSPVSDPVKNVLDLIDQYAK